MKARRRRGLLLLALALVAGGLAAAQVRERERRVEAKVGPTVEVVLAARDLVPGRRLARADLAVERVPAQFVPSDALGSPAVLAGRSPAVPVAAGAYVTAAVLGGDRSSRGGPLRPGERALEIGVSGGAGLAGAGLASRVDVVVSTQRHEGAGRTFVALEDVEVLDLRSSSAPGLSEDPGDGRPADARATLRVTLRQAVYLAAAENFGHEVRLLVRPPGDRRRGSGFSVAEEEL